MKLSRALFCGLSALAVAACRQPDARPPMADPQRPTEAPAHTPDLAPEQLQALAFRTAWGGPPPIEIPAKDEDGEGQTIQNSKLVDLGQGRWALISEGQGGEGHVSSGSLSIHYLRRTADGFERIGAWPEIGVGGTWGAPPQWEVRTDLTPSPAITAQAGGTWQGYTCTWGQLIELTPERPIVRAGQLKMNFDSSGALGDSGQSYEGRLVPGRVGQTFKLDYENSDNDVTYALAGQTYDPVNAPDLPWC